MSKVQTGWGTKILQITCVAVMIALFLSLFVQPKGTPGVDHVNKDSLLWVKGSTPKRNFIAIFVPSCLACNDFTKPNQAKLLAMNMKQDYVLVIKGSQLTVDPTIFGPSWPNVVSVEASSWDAVQPAGGFAIMIMTPNWGVKEWGINIPTLQGWKKSLSEGQEIKL